ncbi:MAG TPA: SH3 domain-containing protein [Pyrinomonadaceae bacterium]|nr:SH3 domain-containing protein [Pyrinomonadaceae bacterium]
MKKCPQCNKVFDDNLVYCTQDGTPLVTENFAPPSEMSEDAEEETVIHREPIVVDFSQTAAPTEQLNYQTPPPIPAPIIVERKSNFWKYLLFMFVGLVFGGSLVLAALFLSGKLSPANNSQTAKTNNSNTANSANKTPQKSPTATPTPFPLNSEHQTRTEEDNEEFNGRVIASTAFVRSAPSKDAAQSDLLPKDDRLKIEKRANDNSPWYYISCEHGTAGWMHGDTIEFTKDAF